LIILESIDSAGKRTHSNLLIEELQRQGKSVLSLESPSYERTVFGRLVGSFLRGEWGSDLPAEACILLYTMDRYQFNKPIEEALSSGSFVIADRYMQSTLAFQGAKVSEEAFPSLKAWAYDLEKRMPKADCVVFIDLPLNLVELNKSGTVLRTFHKQKGVPEELRWYLEKVRKIYRKVAQEENWIVIDCEKLLAENNGKLLTLKIHEEIARQLRERKVV
jgi:dTMP kinase